MALGLAVPRLFGRESWPWPALAVGLLYLVFGGLYLALWFAAPVVAFALFITLTWFDWGGGDLHTLAAFVSGGALYPACRVRRALTLSARGGPPMLVPLLAFPETCRAVVGSTVGLLGGIEVPWWFFDPSFRLLAGTPHLLTSRFEEHADALRVQALVQPLPVAVDWGSLGDLGRIRGFTDTIHYVLPKLLLVVSALDEGLGGERGHRDSQPEADIRLGVAEGAMSLQMVTPGEATGRTAEIFQEIRERHGHPDAASYYRGIARWPEFLDAAWEMIRPVIDTPPYEERKHALLEEARSAVLELPLPCRDEAVERGLKEGQIGEVRAVLAVFRYRVISDMFLDVSLIKAMLDDPEAARSSRFSFAGGRG